jgi:hypothetical protein
MEPEAAEQQPEHVFFRIARGDAKGRASMIDTTDVRTISESDRVAAARLMLVKLGVDTDDPRWSSDVLDRLLKSVMETPKRVCQ